MIQPLLQRCRHSRLASKMSASAHATGHRAEALLTLRACRPCEAVVVELLESATFARLLHSAAGESLSEVSAALGFAR